MNAEKPAKVDDPKAPSWQRVHLWQIQSVRDLLMITAFIGLVYLGYVLSVITVPLLVALGLAYIIDPLVGWLSHRLPWLGRRGAVLSIMGGLGLAFALILIVTVPIVTKQTNQLMQNTDKYTDQVRHFVTAKHLPAWVQDGVETLADFLPKRSGPGMPTATATAAKTARSINASSPASSPLPEQPQIPPSATATATQTRALEAESAHSLPPLNEVKVRALIREELAKYSKLRSGERTDDSNDTASAATASSTFPVSSGTLSTVASGSAQVLTFLWNFMNGAAQIAIFLFIVVFCFYYFSVAFPRVVNSCSTLIPVGKRERILDLTGKMDLAVSGFVRGRLIICAVMGLIYATGWTLCGVPYAVLLGFAIGICGLVPYLSAIGLPIAWLLLIVSLTGETERSGFYFTGEGASAGMSWWKVLLFPTLVNVIAQVVEDYVLNPMIQGKATNLHPAAILLACIAGGSLAGLYGLILAIPVAACMKIVVVDVAYPRLKQWLSGKKEDPLPL